MIEKSRLPYLLGAAILATALPGQVTAETDFFECRWREGEITLDGKADEPAWKPAQPINDWAISWKKNPEERQVSSQTRAKLLWDKDYLYFFADMDDADLYGERKEQDGEIWKDDVFELFFKPAADKPGYYEFEINVLGAVLDMFLPERKKLGYYEYKSDGKFRVERKVVTRGTINERDDTDEGWSVEGRIPWRDFDRTGGAPEPGETWTFALCRYDYSKQFEKGMELSSAAPLTAGDFHQYEDYAPLKFVGPEGSLPESLRKVSGIDSKVEGSPEPPLLYVAEPAWPDWKVTHLVTFIFEPDKNTILFIDQIAGPEPKQKLSRLRRFHPDSGEIDELMEVNALVYSIEFHPKFAENGYFFLGANGPNHIPRAERSTGITRYTMNREAGTVDPETAFEVIKWKSNGHDGAAMAFDNDGLFYVTTGDGTSDSDDDVVGQRMDVLHAKVLRIDIDNPDPGKTYSVPKDNPFVDLEGARPETWAYGLRNPWRMHYDKVAGHLWVAQNGQDLTEQAYFVRKGDNYGWSVYEGSRPFYLERELGPTPHVLPTFEHGHHESRSLMGGVVYRGGKLPEIEGAYVYGDYTTGKIWAGKHDGEKVTWHREIADTTLGLTDIRQGRDGELLVSDYRPNDEGGVYKLVPNPVKTDPKDFPQKLSETGLFTSVKDHAVDPALMPYSVNAEQWTDGAEKSRYIALSKSEPHITFSKRNWKFPDGTVLMQSLALPEGDAKRMVETRLMLKEQGEWNFFTYAWNEEGTDAELVPKEGLDTKIGDQPWRFASRTECGNCHSRAGQFVLGLQAAQLNRDHDYGGGFVANQIETMGKLGLFQSKRRQSKSAPGQRVSPEMTKFVNLQLETLDALADPYDTTQPVEDRARAYLQANCAHCHVGSGGGNAKMLMRYFTPKEGMNIFDAIPNHGHRGLGEEARIAVPGNPGLSVMVPRVSSRGPGQMPPIGTLFPDPQGATLLIQWIMETDKLEPPETEKK